MKTKPNHILNKAGIIQMIEKSLLDYRKERNFCECQYMNDKIKLMNNYFKKYSIKSVVLGLSGGIDSAVCLGLLRQTHIEHISAIFIPAYHSIGVTGQKNAFNRVKNLCEKWSVNLSEVDISEPAELIGIDLEKSLGIESDGWSKGQLIPYLRTTALYYCTTLLTKNKKKSLLIGTTNADEGQYIGYFGKASDGMVDLQIISDLHKSEVYRIAQYLDMTQDILNVIPTGDMYDGRVDEEVFGFPYEFVEFYRYYLNMEEHKKIELRNSLDEKRSLFDDTCDEVERMHQYNGHKYLGCSPAVHLDVLDTRVRGGWTYNVWKNNE